MNATGILHEALSRHGFRTAIETDDREYTYDWLDRMTAAAATALRSTGGPGSRVMLAGDHSVTSVVWALGCLRSGLVYTPVNPRLPPAELRRCAETARPAKILCFDRATYDELAGGAPGTVELAGLPPDEPAPGPAAAVAGETAYSIFTSGSSGEPKLVDVGHRGLLNLCTAQRDLFGLGPGVRVLQFSSLSFDASIAELLTTVYAGATLVVPRLSAGGWLSTVDHYLERHGADVATLPPSVYQRLSDAAVSRIRTVVFAGEALTEPEYRRAARHSDVLNAYGPTEGTVCFSVKRVEEFGDSIGFPIAGYRARIFDAGDGTYRDSGTGELVIAGTGVALGYSGAPDRSERRFTTVEGSPAYHTGDQVTLRDGELFYRGRTDEQIKRLGHRIDLTHLEAKLTGVLGFRAVLAVVAGQLVLVVPEQQAGPSLLPILRDRVAAWEVPERVRPIGELPLSANGKLDRAALGRLLAAAGPVPDPAPDRDGDTFDVVARVTEEVMGSAMDPQMSVYDAGGTSLTLVTLQVQLSEHFGEEPVEAALEKLDYDFTVRDFADALTGIMSEREPVTFSIARTAAEETERLRAEVRRLRATAPAPEPGTVLVTGASGFVGGHLLDRLLDTASAVHVLTSGDPDRVRARLRDDFGRAEADLRRLRFLDYTRAEPLVPCHDVFHCGYAVNHQLPLERQLSTSVHNTAVAVRMAAAMGARTFSFLSAASAGRTFAALSPRTLDEAGDPYSQSKLVAEAYVETLAEAGCATMIHRAGLIYGHSRAELRFLENDRFTAMLRLALRQGTVPAMTGHVPVCDVRHVVDAMITAAKPDATARGLLVERTYSADELLAEIGGRHLRVVDAGAWVAGVKRTGAADPRMVALFRNSTFDHAWPDPVPGRRPILGELLRLAGEDHDGR